MTKKASARALIAEGFLVFPIVPNAKAPPRVAFKEEATCNPVQIEEWWTDSPDNNIGVYTGKYKDGQAILAVDIDNKGDKHGDDEVLRLELEGFVLPPTRETTTPTGGRHLLYSVGNAVRQGANVLGPGIDIRSRGGYIVGPGSETEKGCYTSTDTVVAPAPEWLIEKCSNSSRSMDRTRSSVEIQVPRERAITRAKAYLETEAPASIKGAGGDTTAYAVAARVKDFGVDEATCLDLMLGSWNERSPPGWGPDKLAIKVHNAYKYGDSPPGVADPAADFDPVCVNGVLHPYAELNKEFAFIIAGGGSHILWETTDVWGRWRLEHLDVTSFNRKFASHKIRVSEKDVPVTREWMAWKDRRSYDGLVFMPQKDPPAQFYNLWRGFSVEPWPKDDPAPAAAQEALDAFLGHALENVCQGRDDLFKWLMGYFAHLIQKPWEKPLTALVFRGGKGVGKNALVERIGDLLGGHFLLTSNKRYLTGNFNGHLENCLFFALDEAFWSGDKNAEGAVKDLITGKQHVIEHKGKEPYVVDNKTRVAIIGNESWLVPASHDERRFAVFDVGGNRKQDRIFFETMRTGMENGGYRVLLRYLMGLSLTGIDLNSAPKTEALHDQKLESLELFHQWWHNCLTDGTIVGSDFSDGWPENQQIETGRFRDAFYRYAKGRNVRGRLPSVQSIGRQFRACLPKMKHPRIRIDGKKSLGYAYELPPLEYCRSSWDTFIGHQEVWED